MTRFRYFIATKPNRTNFRMTAGYEDSYRENVWHCEGASLRRRESPPVRLNSARACVRFWESPDNLRITKKPHLQKRCAPAFQPWKKAEPDLGPWSANVNARLIKKSYASCFKLTYYLWLSSDIKMPYKICRFRFHPETRDTRTDLYCENRVSNTQYRLTCR